MLRRLPIIATMVVLLAIVTMVRLGFWQMDRLHQKEAMMARFASAQSLSAEVAWPQGAAQRQAVQYRHTVFDCSEVLSVLSIAGRNKHGQSGWAHLAKCADAGGGRAEVVLGWSRDPALQQWSGGKVSGLFQIAGQYGARITATTPPKGLEPSARPDPRDLPNNHLSYAVQWFLFALVALVIYVLAVRKRLAASDERG